LRATQVKCEEYAEATKALRSCLKLYADRGVPEYSAEVKRARQLFKEAQNANFDPPHDKMMHETVASPHNQNIVMSIMMETPQTSMTMPSALTEPSTTYSRESSGAGTSRPGQGQLQTLLEELDMGGHDAETAVSPMHGGCHGQSMFPKLPLSELLKSSGKLDKSSLEEGNTYMKKQLEDFKASKVEKSHEVEGLILRIKEIEKERDQERKDRVLAAVAHQKILEALAQDKMTNAITLAECESLKKIADVSETSYKELVLAIDNEKEKINNAQASKVQQLEDEIQRLRDKSNYTGAIESARLSEELTAKRKEIAMLKEQCQKTSREVTSLTATNRKLQSEKDSAAIEISGLKSEIDHLQSEIKRVSSQSASANVPERNTDINNLKFELQTERNRREILESSLQKEYDKPPPPPTCMPFGYPPMPMQMLPMQMPMQMPMQIPMQMPMQMYAPDNSSNSKLKVVEIDLATERAIKEQLENVIQELRSTHQKDRSAMQQEISDLHRTREQEIPDLHRTRAEVDRLNQELGNVQCSNDELSRQLDDTTNELSDTLNELSDVKNRMLQISCELSSTIEEKDDEKRKLSNAAKELLSTREDLNKIKEDLKNSKDFLRRKEAEVECWSSENARLKKEYGEAITMFEAEICRGKEDKEEIESKVRRLQSDLSTAKLHLQDLLEELEAARTDATHSTMALDSSRADVRAKEKQLDQAQREASQARKETSQAQQEMNELTNNYEELTAYMCKLQENVSAERKALSQKNDETLEKLRSAETAIEVVNKIVSNLKSENNDFTARLSFYKKMESILRSIPLQLETVVSDFYSSTNTNEEAPDDEESNPTLDSLESRTSHLLQCISTHIKELKGDIQSRDRTLEKTQWHLSNTAQDFSLMESKYKTLKKKMNEVGNLQQDYDELLDQYKLLDEDMETLEHHLTSTHLEKEQKLQEERDVFESRLREAVDDLEELESERNTLKNEHDRALAESVRKDGRIRALEIDNQLIETLEKQALEYDAALFEKDIRIENLDEKLKSFQSKLEALEKQAVEYDAALFQKDMKIDALEVELLKLETLKKQSKDDAMMIDTLEEELHSSIHRRDPLVFPNVPYFNQDTANMGWFAANVLIQENSETNQVTDDSSALTEEGDEKQATNPFDEDSVVEERNYYQGDMLKAGVYELDGPKVSLRNKADDAIVWSLEREEHERMLNEAATLKDKIHTLEISNDFLESQLAGFSDEVNDSEAISCLRNALDKSYNDHREELICWTERVHELQNICNQSMIIIKAESGTSPNDQIFDLDEIADLPSAIVTFSSRTKREVILLQNEIQTLKGCIEKLSAQLARSEACAIENAKAHENAMTDLESTHQAARENDLALISSLQNAIEEKEILLRETIHQALMDQDELHQHEIGTLKSQMVQLEESNKALNLELIDLSVQPSISVPDGHTECNKKLALVEMDLKQSLIDREDTRIKQSIELASINAEFHNAMVSVDELLKENQKIKRDIEILLSKETVEDRNFEKEMNAAHTRFESMEKALQQRVSRLEGEKHKLVAEYNAERNNKEDEHTKTRIELCAWKLGMTIPILIEFLLGNTLLTTPDNC
jgi:chromosome segregation ATPase